MINNDYNETVILIREFLVSRKIDISKFYLFGSRSRDENHIDSDYDFMIVINNELKPSEKRTLLGDIYRYLMNKNGLIVMDLIIKTANKFSSESREIGYISNTVLREGIEI